MERKLNREEISVLLSFSITFLYPSMYSVHVCSDIILRTTVEPPITDTPNSGHPPNNGRQLMYQLLFPR